MTPAELLALANRLLYACRDPVTGEPLYAGVSADACVEDVEAAARYLRACAEAEPVAYKIEYRLAGKRGVEWQSVSGVYSWRENAEYEINKRAGSGIEARIVPLYAGTPE